MRQGQARPTNAAAAAGVLLRPALWMLLRIVAVSELAVLDLGGGALRHVDRASGAWARVASAQVVEGGPGGIWEAIEDVYAGWHAAGEPEHPDIGLSIDREGRQRLWLHQPDECGCS
jgi:hypothetical protein